MRNTQHEDAPGANTRCASASTARGSGTCSSTSSMTTASTEWSSSGSAPRPLSTGSHGIQSRGLADVIRIALDADHPAAGAARSRQRCGAVAEGAADVGDEARILRQPAAGPSPAPDVGEKRRGRVGHRRWDGSVARPADSSVADCSSWPIPSSTSRGGSAPRRRRPRTGRAPRPARRRAAGPGERASSSATRCAAVRYFGSPSTSSTAARRPSGVHFLGASRTPDSRLDDAPCVVRLVPVRGHDDQGHARLERRENRRGAAGGHHRRAARQELVVAEPPGEVDVRRERPQVELRRVALTAGRHDQLDAASPPSPWAAARRMNGSP